MQLPIPSRPWETISCDLFSLNETSYLITVDHLSNFFEIDKSPTTTTQMVIRKLRPHFGHYGQPEVMTTDNGPQFTSAEFGKFAAEWNFEHRTSSPNHQQGNGRSEAAVKIAKNLIRKAHAAGQDPYKALLAYRNTLQEGLHYGPSQRFLGRRTRTSLPTSSTLLQLQQPSYLKNLMQRRQD